jgi:hypothetical protein
VIPACAWPIAAAASHCLGAPARSPGGYVVRDATGQSLVYVYSRDNEAEALQAKVLTKDEARRIAVNVARLPQLLGKAD